MDNHFKDLVEQLRTEIKETPEYQRYVRLKAFIDAHPEYISREEELKLLQKDMVQTLNDREYDQYERHKTNYETKKTAFENDPAVVEYQLAKEDLNDLLIEVAQLIESALNNEVK